MFIFIDSYFIQGCKYRVFFTNKRRKKEIFSVFDTKKAANVIITTLFHVFFEGNVAPDGIMIRGIGSIVYGTIIDRQVLTH